MQVEASARSCGQTCQKGSSLNPVFDQRSYEYKWEMCRGRAAQSSQQAQSVAATCFPCLTASLQRGALGSKNTNRAFMTCLSSAKCYIYQCGTESCQAVTLTPWIQSHSSSARPAVWIVLNFSIACFGHAKNLFREPALCRPMPDDSVPGVWQPLIFPHLALGCWFTSVLFFCEHSQNTFSMVEVAKGVPGAFWKDFLADQFPITSKPVSMSDSLCRGRLATLPLWIPTAIADLYASRCCAFAAASSASMYLCTCLAAPHDFSDQDLISLRAHGCAIKVGKCKKHLQGWCLSSWQRTGKLLRRYLHYSIYMHLQKTRQNEYLHVKICIFIFICIFTLNFRNDRIIWYILSLFLILRFGFRWAAARRSAPPDIPKFCQCLGNLPKQF